MADEKLCVRSWNLAVWLFRVVLCCFDFVRLACVSASL